MELMTNLIMKKVHNDIAIEIFCIEAEKEKKITES